MPQAATDASGVQYQEIPGMRESLSGANTLVVSMQEWPMVLSGSSRSPLMWQPGECF